MGAAPAAPAADDSPREPCKNRANMVNFRQSKLLSRRLESRQKGNVRFSDGFWLCKRLHTKSCKARGTDGGAAARSTALKQRSFTRIVMARRGLSSGRAMTTNWIFVSSEPPTSARSAEFLHRSRVPQNFYPTAPASSGQDDPSERVLPDSAGLCRARRVDRTSARIVQPPDRCGAGSRSGQRRGSPARPAHPRRKTVGKFYNMAPRTAVPSGDVIEFQRIGQLARNLH